MEKPSGPSLFQRLAIHLAGYVVLLTLVTAIIPLDASFGGDDGAYAGQVYALQQGGWVLDRPVPVVPQANEGWLNTAITPAGPTPYTTNPAYVVLLKTATDLIPTGFGSTPSEGAGANAFALQLVPVLGALLSAIVAWSLASRWSPDRVGAGAAPAPLAFWIVALGPVLVNATTLWAHTVSTALGGASLLFLLALHDDHRRGPLLLRGRALPATALLLTTALAATMRTEAIFWMAALLATAFLVLRSRVAMVGASAASMMGAAAWFANRAWGQSLRADQLPIETSINALGPSSGWLDSRIPATWQLLFTSTGGGIGPALSLLAVSIALFAAVKLRRDPDGADATAITFALVVCTLLYGAQLVLAPGDVISGTFAAWPIVTVLLLGGRRPVIGSSDLSKQAATSDHHRPIGLAALLVPVGVLGIAVVFTQYANSGGHQWGGRYLSMGFAPLGAAAAVMGVSLVAQHRITLTALLVAPALLGVVASYNLHTNHHEVVAATTSEPSEVVVTELHALPRIAWPALPIAFYVASDADIEALLNDLARSEVTTVNVQGFDDLDLDGTAGYRITTETTEIRHLELQPDAVPAG